MQAWAFHFQDRHTCRQLGKSRRRYPVLVSDWAGKQKILHTHIDQEQLRARLRQCTVIEQRELMGFLLEFLLISAVAKLVRQGTAEAV